MNLDSSWTPVLVLVGVVVTALGGYAASWLTSRTAREGKATDDARERDSKAVDDARELIDEYRKIKKEIQEDALERERILNGRIDSERTARLEFERRLTAQFDEVVLHFAVYVDWARAGAKPPPPTIPAWIYARIMELRSGAPAPE